MAGIHRASLSTRLVINTKGDFCIRVGQIFGSIFSQSYTAGALCDRRAVHTGRAGVCRTAGSEIKDAHILVGGASTYVPTSRYR